MSPAPQLARATNKDIEGADRSNLRSLFWGLLRPEDVKKLISLKFCLNRNVCRRPSGRLYGILARFFLRTKLLHVSKSIFSHLPVPEKAALFRCHQR
jgi:hypothetical protein